MTVNHKDMSKKKWRPVLDPEIPKVKITVVKKEQVKEEQQVPTCPHCGSPNCYGISRVVGYFSIIENWNNSKKSELKRRQAGNYWSEEK